MKSRSLFVLMLCIASLSACQDADEVAETTDEATMETEKSEEPETHKVHWGYEGDEGPEHWASLSPDFSMCADGTKQSPIDLTDAEVVEGVVLRRMYGTAMLSLDQRASTMDLIDNGHTIQISSDAPVALDIAGNHYELVQYHFHSPSEHTIDGEHAPLEMHAVHESAEGELAVIGVLIDEGEYNPVADPVIARLPNDESDVRHIEDLDLDPDEFLPPPMHYFRYRGSLTTPPCSEGVEWIVSAERRQMSAEQIEAFTSRLDDNNRPVQALGERELLELSK
jgi:carbonic anhydrase